MTLISRDPRKMKYSQISKFWENIGVWSTLLTSYLDEILFFFPEIHEKLLEIGLQMNFSFFFFLAILRILQWIILNGDLCKFMISKMYTNN